MRVEAVHPAREVAGAVGEDRVLRQVALEPVDDVPHLHRAGILAPHGPRAIVGIRRTRRLAPAGRIDRLQRRERRSDLRHAGVDQQLALVHAPQLLGAGVHVHEALRRPRRVEQRVAAGRHLAEARTDREHEIGVLDPLRELRVEADADVADVVRMAVVEDVLEAERAADWGSRSPPRTAADRRTRPGSSRCRRRSRSAVPRRRASRAAARCRRRPGAPAPPGTDRCRRRPPSRPARPRAARARPAPCGPTSRSGRHGSRTRACGPRGRSRPPTSPFGRTCGGSPLPGTLRARRSRCRPGR